MVRRAVRLGLVGVVFLWGTVGHALEPHIAQPPPSSGVAEDRPPPEGQADGEAADHERAVQQPAAPTPAAEGAEQAERREAKERRAEEREQADLDAQRSMAESARKMLRPAWWQVLIAGLGAVLLSISLGFSAWAAKAASNAANAAQEVLKAERAWLVYDYKVLEERVDAIGDESTSRSNDAIAFRFRILNCGKTPALHVQLGFTHDIIRENNALAPFDQPPYSAEGAVVVGPGSPITTEQRIIAGEVFAEFLAGRCNIALYSRVKYNDIFSPNADRFSEACICASVVGEISDGRRRGVRISYTPIGRQNTAT